MIRADRLPLCAALALGISVPATAQGDARLQTREYDEATVYRIDGKVKVQTTIRFREDELIENVAIGDSQAWQVQPNKAQSLLFVKPLATNAQTNMTVVTNRRTYLFDLVAGPRNSPLYVLKFSYPAAEAAEEQARLSAAEAKAVEQANAIEMAAAADPFAVSDPARLNFAWSGAGDADLIPERAYDDGDAVFLTWPAGTPIPAILVTNHDGEEGPVNFTVRGETIVLDMVPHQIILRSGEDAATLTNNAEAAGVLRDVPAQASRKRGD